MKRKILVVGAGIGGLTAGSLLAKHGLNVTLLEASSELGGCAGKFRRRSFLFPAGATLGMGLEPGGIHERVFRYLDKPFPFEPLNHVMEMVHPGSTFTFLKNRDEHVNHIVHHFPAHEQQIRSFYREIYRTASIVRTLMKPLPALPPVTLREWRHLLSSVRPIHVQLAPFMRQTLGQRLKAHGLAHLLPFRHMLDGLLIDSMQTGSEDVSYLLSAVALDIYHEGAYYVPGGLYQFAELMGNSIKENGGSLKKRRTVVHLEHRDDHWLATDQRSNTYTATDVVLNVPLQQFPAILNPDLMRRLHKRLRNGTNTPTWTTLTLYIAIKTAGLPAPLPPFRQISTGNGLAEGAHFFVSASQPDDFLRAPAGFQTVTISTHSAANLWRTQEQYEAQRALLTERMLEALETVVPGFRDSIVHIESGAPRGWTHYTGRPNGFVGGFPQTLSNALFNSISHHSGIPGLYVCGDHIFPGGGTIGAATSGIHAARSVSGSHFI